MEGKGGCCIARYAGSMGYLGSKVDRIMLRYRPIAPKPAAGGAPPLQSSPLERSDSRCGAGRKVGVVRPRRRGVRDSKRCRKQRRTSPEGTMNSDGSEGGESHSPVVTLPLLPLTPERKDDPPPSGDDSSPSYASSSSSSENISGQYQPIGLKGLFPVSPAVTVPQPVRPLWSCVTVESVTDTWELGGSDEEKRWRLEADTCPAFMTDAWNCVRWVNDAYKRMVGQTGRAGVILALATKEKLPEAEVPVFSCRVRVQYTCEKETNSLTVPCDVWRMAGGGCAWRLDVNTALCLGR
ncbi:uncharacterized protein [Aristolochia californica]|uniref:uncharacterized protein n=1 Tax=Aristolochia californica TaxID=171875 RepID=UPI0035D6B65C